jgi:hypothetical protein
MERKSCRPPGGKIPLRLFDVQCGCLPDPIVPTNSSLEYLKGSGHCLNVFGAKLGDLPVGVYPQFIQLLLNFGAYSVDFGEVIPGLPT